MRNVKECNACVRSDGAGVACPGNQANNIGCDERVDLDTYKKCKL